MPPRRLSPPERAVWGQVARTVTPIVGKVAPEVVADTRPELDQIGSSLRAKRGNPYGGAASGLPRRSAPRKDQCENLTDFTLAPQPSSQKSARAVANTLDAGWDKRLAKGMVSPDRVIDLHGETLSTAHARLYFALRDAVLCGDRLILLITGKPARDNPRLPPTSRGVIRALIADWLASSSYASKIAAVRNAHPRHGGAGALYVILRRARG